MVPDTRDGPEDSERDPEACDCDVRVAIVPLRYTQGSSRFRSSCSGIDNLGPLPSGAHLSTFLPLGVGGRRGGTPGVGWSFADRQSRRRPGTQTSSTFTRSNRRPWRNGVPRGRTTWTSGCRNVFPQWTTSRYAARGAGVVKAEAGAGPSVVFKTSRGDRGGRSR